MKAIKKATKAKKTSKSKKAQKAHKAVKRTKPTRPRKVVKKKASEWVRVEEPAPEGVPQNPPEDPRDASLRDATAEAPDDIRTPREKVLDTARRLVSQDRQASYGSPSMNFSCAADLKTVYWTYFYSIITSENTERLKLRGHHSPFGHAIDLILTNLARWATSPQTESQEDRSIDIAGYAALAQEVSTKASAFSTPEMLANLMLAVQKTI